MRAVRVFALAALAAAVTSFAPRAGAFDKHACVQASDQGQALRLDGHLIAAREQLLVCADPSCPQMVRASCAEWLASLDAQLPTVLFVVKDAAGADVPSARVSIDGKLTDPGALARAVPIDPGTHTVHVAAPTEDASDQTVVVREGDVRRSILVTLPRRAPGTLAPQRSQEAPPDRTPWAAWGVAIGAGVAWATFGAFALSGHLQYDDLKTQCAPRCASDRYDPISTKFIVADVALGVAVIATGVAAFLFLTAPRSPSSRTSVARPAALVSF